MKEIMKNSCEERRAGQSNEFYEMNILSESNELLNIEKQEKNKNCCAKLQCWKANNNSNNTVTDEDTKQTSCLDKLKGIHVMFKIIAVLIGLIITLSPFIPKIVAGINATETTTELLPTPTSTTIMVILRSLSDSYIINGDGSTKKAAQISGPSNGYTYDAQSAVVADKLYLFGGNSGDRRKIARLESCTIVELTVKLNNDFRWGQAALATADNSQALICFAWKSPQKYCNIFDGSTVVTTFSTTYSHSYGGLAYYNGQPTTVGSRDSDGYGKVETLSQNGWTSLADSPINVFGHNLIGMENGDLLLIGGRDKDSGAYQSKVWRLSSATWTEEATLQKAVYGGSAIKLHNQIFSFAGINGNGEYPIQRLDLTEDGTIDQIDLIGNQDVVDTWFWFPILYIVDAHTCTNN